MPRRARPSPPSMSILITSSRSRPDNTRSSTTPSTATAPGAPASLETQPLLSSAIQPTVPATSVTAASWISTFANPFLDALRRSSSVVARPGSTASTRPPGPTRDAASMEDQPMLAPMSTNVCPGRSAAEVSRVPCRS